MEEHISVLKEEAINFLNVKDGGIYVDATLGFAGHAREVLKRNKKGFLFAFDKDILACDKAALRLKEIGSNFKIFHKANKDLKETLAQEGVFKVDGVLFDLGLSSMEIDNKERGFSYMQDAPLDMRMDKSATLTAYTVVNTYSKEDLIRIFRNYGEEEYAGRIANNIVKERSVKPIATTLQLVKIIDYSIPFNKRKGHKAKKVFQALRIEVNHELEEFEEALNDAISMLNVGGVVCVITFHSLEDRICKQIMRKMTTVDEVVKGLPNVPCDLLPDFELVNKKPILPSDLEIKRNKRAASAKLRAIRRIKEGGKHEQEN